jgi:hypothetical protein
MSLFVAPFRQPRHPLALGGLSFSSVMKARPHLIACHPEAIRRGWLKDLNFFITDQLMFPEAALAPSQVSSRPERPVFSSARERECWPRSGGIMAGHKHGHGRWKHRAIPAHVIPNEERDLLFVLSLAACSACPQWRPAPACPATLFTRDPN